ncbi:MAG: glycosyltransferase [Candidatus Aminicenantes bacterium]|nr:glycosyltransferase [Candidatus Aminicenantes bacterium]
MARVLVTGVAPLPFENQRKNYALNNRTWLIAKALMEEGHQVCLLCLRVKGAYFDEERLDEILFQKIHANLSYYSLAREVFRPKLLNRHYRDFRPDCIVGAGTVPSSYAARIRTDKPMWADLFGSLLAEAQAKAAVYDDDFYPAFWRRLEIMTLKRADIFSTVSIPQKYAVIGELGLLGRLNKHTLNYDFVRVIPICLDDEPFSHSKIVLRNKLVHEDDFVILWCGGYNTWTDVETLFDGLVKAMAKNRKIKFVSTGGAIERHDEMTFSRFINKVKQSRFSEKFIFSGWIPTQDVGNYYLESDVGINVDRFSYEALLGARNRLNEMMKASLPIITTKIAEISGLVEKKELGITYPIGDSDALAGAILSLADDPARLKRYKENLANYSLQELSYKTLMHPLREWVKDPMVAPDFGKKVRSDHFSSLRKGQYLARQVSLILKKEGVKGVIRQAKKSIKGLTKS